jgi:hypothetical protein
MESEVDESRIIDDDVAPIDPPMSEYERGVIRMLRSCFPSRLYTVYKARDGKKNDSGLDWNFDYSITRGKHILVAVFKVLGPDTTLENLDIRMRDAFAVFALGREYHSDSFYPDLHHRMLLVPDGVMEELGTQGYRPYHFAFERLSVEIERLGEATETLKRYRKEIEQQGL